MIILSCKHVTKQNVPYFFLSAQASWFDFNSSEAVSFVAVDDMDSPVTWEAAFENTPNSANYSNIPAAWEPNGTVAKGDKLFFFALSFLNILLTCFCL